jgi:hypothetical protein
MSRILTVDAAGKLRVYGEPETADADARRLADIDRLISAAQSWREFQSLNSVMDQKTDLQLRIEAEVARQSLMTAIDNLENE